MSSLDPNKTLKVTGRVTFRNIGGQELGIGVVAGVLTVIFFAPLGIVLEYGLALVNTIVFVFVGIALRRMLPGPSGAYLLDWFMSHHHYLPQNDPVHLPIMVERQTSQPIPKGVVRVHTNPGQRNRQATELL